MRREREKGLENLVPQIKSAHVKKIKMGLKLVMDEVIDRVSRYSDVADDEQWEEIFRWVEFKL
jgi:hypothetical protein